jgi:NADH:ubiquinone oxidoreductase subunit E/NAD-dependent dihydropyrimidine dehydrogenase PreA subunit
MKKDNKVGAVLVVGAGIGGVQASLDLADSGYKVYLMDKQSAIGGTMAQLDKTFPTNDCSMCILAPKLVDAGRHENIEVITLSDVEALDGEPGNFKVRIKKRPRYVDESKCTGCGTCWSNCPVTSKPQIPEDGYKVSLAEDDVRKVSDIIDKYRQEKSVLIPVLQEITREYGYLPKDILVYVSVELDIPLSQIHSVATFYTAFSLEPRGKYMVSVCLGTACHVQGGGRILERLERELKISSGETTKDKLFSLEAVRCLGCCGLAPVFTVNEDLYGKVTQSKVTKLIKKYRDRG